ncbi:ferritin heavy chain-like [Phyllostomus hastatus]|uniref:ferritin heavy chain-like n=1 Tax=Phyllostomus hastatus TaxID=9423 RepID=UPI001E68156F|nr:ferritin heavy chain-like [Phyllostomus hastatus]
MARGRPPGEAVVSKALQGEENSEQDRPEGPHVHQNRHPEREAALNKHIDPELPAFYVYLSTAFCLGRQEVPLKRFAAFWLRQRREEWEQAQVLMRLQNQRGERARLGGIPRPDRCRWESGQRAMKSALHIERMVSQGLPNLSAPPPSTTKNDAHLYDFLEHHHLRQDAKFIRNLAASIIISPSKLGATESSLAELPL